MRSRAVLLLLASLMLGAAAPQPDRSRLPGVGAHDQRVPVDAEMPPWRAVVRVQSERAARCTGFLIAPDTVITAVHCLYVPGARRFQRPSGVLVMTSYARGRFDSHTDVRTYRIGPGYDPRRVAATRGADWAVLQLASPLGTPDRILRLAAARPGFGQSVALAGYGQDQAETMTADLSCALATRMIDGEKRELLRHTCEGTRGTSGAPLLARARDGGWMVIGIQVAGRLGDAGGLAVPITAIRPRLRAGRRGTRWRSRSGPGSR